MGPVPESAWQESMFEAFEVVEACAVARTSC